jgi:ParB family chromosome partitioning protein
MSKSVADKMGGDRYEIYTCPPERLVIVLDKSNVLYDERGDENLFPLREAMVLDVMSNGIINAVKVRRNGSWPDGLYKYEVVAGRQRVRHAIEANRRLALSGQPPIVMKLDVVTGDDNAMFELMIRENEHRQTDLVSFIIAKIVRAGQRGFTPNQIMAMFGIKSQATFAKYKEMADLHPELLKAADRGVPMSTLLGLGDLERSEQLAALAALEASGATRGEAAADAVAEATGQPVKAKKKKKIKRSLKWKDIEKEKQAILKEARKGRYWEGVVAGMLLCQGESKKMAFEDAPGGGE